jgi:hypothetical protein
MFSRNAKETSARLDAAAIDGEPGEKVKMG